MGDSWSSSQAPTIEVTANGTAPIESIQILDADGPVRTWRPAVSRSHSRLRVSWRGARDRNRNRVQDWSGGLRVEGANIVEAEEWAFDHPDQGISGRTQDTVTWSSSTNGDPDGVVLTLEGSASTIDFAAGGVSLRVPAAEIPDDGLEIAIDSGVDRAVNLMWMPGSELPLDAYAVFDDLSIEPGRNAFVVKVTQSDGHCAWASPMFVEAD